jgi:hypothetical protein
MYRVVWLFPAPVRVAHTAITGTGEGSIVAVRSEQPEVGAGSERDRRTVHHVDM